MEEWPAWKLARVKEVIVSAGLPDHGQALDFGCGNCIFTELLATLLPGWAVYGTDISEVAIAKAQKRFQGARFLAPAEVRSRLASFDFVFSHRVLEHVEDLTLTLSDLASYSTDGGRALHILPCGNRGSLERRICSLRENGIDDRGRFFFEEPTHARRLTSDNLANLFQEHGFSLERQLFANQEAGAINWITEGSPKLILRITDASAAVDIGSRGELRRLRTRLLVRSILRAPAHRIGMIRRRRRRRRMHYLLFILAAPAWPFSIKFDQHLTRAAQTEWDTRQSDPGGSEMYMLFSRQR